MPHALAMPLVAAILAAAPAVPPDYASRPIGEWTVTPSEDASGCFITRTYDRDGETTVLLGVDADGTNRLSVLNAHWSIRPRDRLRLTYRLSGAAYARQQAIGIAADGRQGFVASFEPRFPALFAASRTLEILRGNVPVERLDLDGSGAAVAALRDCVATTQRAAPAESRAGRRRANDIPRDPFAPPPRSRR